MLSLREGDIEEYTRLNVWDFGDLSVLLYFSLDQTVYPLAMSVDDEMDC